MQTKVSLKKNIIKFDENSKNKSIEEILNERFEWDFSREKTIKDLHDPYLLLWMDKAVARIKEAFHKKERVMIFWDYDVDWVTSTSILMHFFKKVGIEATYRLPHRIKDWYWLRSYFIDEAKSLWVSLVVTVDCWTRDVEIIKYAKSIWIDVIVTDHHAVPEIIPEEAVAIINPKNPKCNYPFKYLAGAWVAFKLIQALAWEFLKEEEIEKYLLESIDICAIWTVADCMKITWENRIIVTEWLKQLKNSRSKWIRKLIEEEISKDLDADIFGFKIWPRLNAAWRMDSPYKAVNLILNNSTSVFETIFEIEELNNKRKLLTKDFAEKAISSVNSEDNLLFYISDEIPHWIIWIVAWKITEQFHKPCICLKDEWDKLVASCRSPEYFSIIEIIENYKDYFLAFGWHKQAAWFSISREKFPEFKEKILEEINKFNFTENKKEIFIDKIVLENELWFKFLEAVTRFKPFGIWNPRPVFMIENFEYGKLEFMWQGREHFKFTNKNWFKIFAFFFWEFYEQIKNSEKISIIFDLSEDSWMWKKSLMLKVIDVII